MKRKRPKIFAGFTNIRVLPSGYQVAITRAKVEVTRHFAGHTEESLAAALRFRDRLLKKMPPKRLNQIPPKILRAAGLTEPPPGVFRKAQRRAYTVSWFERGRVRTRQLGFGRRPELEVLLEALKLRRSMEKKLSR